MNKLLGRSDDLSINNNESSNFNFEGGLSENFSNINKDESFVNNLSQKKNILNTTSNTNIIKNLNNGTDKIFHIEKVKYSKNFKLEIIQCIHTDRKYHALGMCKNCYHNRGRRTKATACKHKNRSNYSFGLCNSCYQLKKLKEKVVNRIV